MAIRKKMARERVVSHHNLKTKSLLKVRIMVVDDDSTSLKIVSAMLKNCSDQDGMNMELVVFSVNNPLDALAALRMRKGKFDLVVSDLHMPEMNGMELQKHVEEEFNLPVIIMSSDDQESAILRSLEDGAAFYIVKPVNRNDLRNVWQYAFISKKGKFNSVESNNETSPISPEEKIAYEDDNVDSESSMDNGNDSSVDVKKRGKKRPKEEEEEEEDHDNDDEGNPIARKKAKVVWTNSLHNRFLQAINQIGLEKSVPKRILEFMNVPGLTRENVASHLQKYRIFLRRVAERGSNPQRNFERSRRSNFAPTFPTSINKLPHNEPQIEFHSQLNQQPTFHPGLGWNTPATNRPWQLAFNVEASSNNLPSQPSCRQPHLLGANSSSFNRPLALLGASNQSTLGLQSSSSTTTTGPYCLTMNAITIALSDNNNASQGFQLENQWMNQLNLGGMTPLHQRFEWNESERINPVSAVVGNTGKDDANNSSNPFLSANYDHTALWVANDVNLFRSGGHPQSNCSNRIANNGQSLLDWLHSDVSSNVGNGSYENNSYSFDKALSSPPTNSEMPNIVAIFNGPTNLGGFLFDANGNVINNSSSSDSSNFTEDENNYLVPDEQQGEEGIDKLMPQLPSSDFPTSFSNQYNTPSIEQVPVNQVQGGQEIVNADFNGNANENQMEKFCSTSELLQGSEDIMDLELSSLLSIETSDTLLENHQNWDELMDSLLGDDPF